jgi:hypothetical protein
MSATIIRNGRVIDPANKRDEVGDVCIENVRLGPKLMRLTQAISSLRQV